MDSLKDGFDNLEAINTALEIVYGALGGVPVERNERAEKLAGLMTNAFIDLAEGRVPSMLHAARKVLRHLEQWDAIHGGANETL